MTFFAIVGIACCAVCAGVLQLAGGGGADSIGKSAALICIRPASLARSDTVRRKTTKVRWNRRAGH